MCGRAKGWVFTMWFVYTMVTVLFWSGSDLFSKMGSAPQDKNSHWKMVIAVGSVMGLHALWQVTAGGVQYDPVNLLRYLPVSALYIVSMIFGYAGLRYIELSVSSPICNSSGAITALLCFLFLGQRMSGLQFGAVALISVGIVALAVLEQRAAARARRLAGQAAADRRYTHSALALALPLLYCLLDGLGTFADAFVLDVVMDEVSANLSYEFTFLAMAVGAYLYLRLAKKERFLPQREKVKYVAALCETAGQFSYVFALSGNAIVAAPTIASYSIFSVLWSRLFLKEKLSKGQYAVIAAVLVGIAILGLE